MKAAAGGLFGLILFPLIYIGVAGSADDAKLAAYKACASYTGDLGDEGRNEAPDSTGKHGAYINLPLREADQAAGVSVSEIPQGKWVYPVDPPINIGTRFGETGPHWSRGHTGTDFPKPQGAPVYAATTGIVLHIQHMEGSSSPAYGNYILLLHADNVVTMYAHLSAIGDIREGQMVHGGDEIGKVGATGNVTGPHLHFEVRPMINGQHLPVNAEPYLTNAGTVKPKGDTSGSDAADPGRYVSCTLGGGAGGAVDATALPALARKMAPTINRLQSSICPELPQVWIYAEVMAESSWDPSAWTYDSNGGAAGLYQMGSPAWIAANGGDYKAGWAPGQKPPLTHPVWDPARNLEAGITYVCGNLRQMTRYLAGHPEKSISPLDAMAVCHVAGCSRVTLSHTGMPTSGEAGCGDGCVGTIRAYLNNIHKYVTEFGASATAAVGKAGPIPVAVTIPGPPSPYTGGATGCTEKDPTGGRCVTGATAHGYTEILKQWPTWASIGCQAPRSEGGEHPLGRACDFAPGPLGERAAASQLSQGWALAGWLRANAQALHVQYIIWQGRIWSVNRPQDQDGGWGRQYDNGLNDPTTITGGHYDHVHVTYRD